jgi:hypothetical protein
MSRSCILHGGVLLAYWGGTAPHPRATGLLVALAPWLLAVLAIVAMVAQLAWPR